MANKSGETKADQLGKSSMSKIARLAQDYIEGNYQNNIRFEDLCAYTGVSLHTLQ